MLRARSKRSKVSEELGKVTMASGAAPTEVKYSKFTQQELPACKPLLTPKWVITTFCMIGVVFVPIGAICLQASNSVVEVRKRYDHTCFPTDSKSWSAEKREAELMKGEGNGVTCVETMEIPEDMDAPVYVYYDLDNFFQNHRRYVKSRSDPQLRGESVAASSLAACDPKRYINDDKTAHPDPVNPCGLVAWSYFNDTYSFTIGSGGAVEALDVDETGIAWKSDVEDKYSDHNATGLNTIPAYRGGGTVQGPLNQDEHFVVWMRTAALPNFRKLWGKIDRDLKKGDVVSVAISNRYNTYRFDGKKYVVLSTTSWLGGKNDFLGVAYLVVGCICFLLGLAFFLVHWRHPRQLGDVTYLSWNKKHLASASG